MSFDAQPVLGGRLVEVRPLREEDLEPLYAVGGDPRIWEQHPFPNRHERGEFERFFREQLASGGGLAVVDVATGAIIGSSRYHGYDAERREVEIGWTFLARSHWGGEYNADLKRLMLAHAFRSVDRVVFFVGPQNVRSQRALEKLGARRAGTREDGGAAYELPKPVWLARTGGDGSTRPAAGRATTVARRSPGGPGSP